MELSRCRREREMAEYLYELQRGDRKRRCRDRGVGRDSAQLTSVVTRPADRVRPAPWDLPCNAGHTQQPARPRAGRATGSPALSTSTRSRRRQAARGSTQASSTLGPAHAPPGTRTQTARRSGSPKASASANGAAANRGHPVRRRRLHFRPRLTSAAASAAPRRRELVSAQGRVERREEAAAPAADGRRRRVDEAHDRRRA
jgi:hypothetical protein